MTESQINAYIDTLHFNTFKKVASKVKQHFPGITDAEIRNIIKKRIHDKRISKDNKKIYQVKVFSKFPNAWMCDIFDNLANNEPRYWYIFININTRFAEAYPMRNKTKDCINTVLRLFVNKYHPRKITSDEEAGLVSALNVDFLKDNKCGLYIIQEKKHSALSLIDRFILLRSIYLNSSSVDTSCPSFVGLFISRNVLMNRSISDNAECFFSCMIYSPHLLSLRKSIFWADTNPASSSLVIFLG